MHLLDLLAISVTRFPDRVALEVDGPDGHPVRISYRELDARIASVAGALAGCGLAPGDRIAFYLGNRLELVLAYCAALRLGAVVLPMNTAYRRRELEHLVGDAEPTVLLTEISRLPALEADGLAGRVDRTLLAEELADLPRAALSPSHRGGDDLALLLYTSGTTGRSKGAMISHHNVLATVTGLLAAWAWSPDDELLLTLPLFHTHGLVVGLTTALAAGATVRLRPRFDADEALDVMSSGRATLFFGVPTLYGRLVDALEARADTSDLSGMRLFCSGSAPLDPTTFDRFRELTGHEILERYGMTETGMNLSNRYAGPRLPGTVGVPLPGVSTRIVGPSGAEVSPGEEGELLVRGSNVFRGYWRRPDATAEAFLPDEAGRRWFRTGDLARQDSASGHVTLLGRRHELIISGGFNLYPREVEEALLGLPGIREAAVVGRPHPEWGEVPVAYLVSDHPVDPEATIAALRRELASFKVPRTYVRLPALPRNALGKVQKHRLPDQTD